MTDLLCTLHISVLSFSKWFQSYFKHFKAIMTNSTHLKSIWRKLGVDRLSAPILSILPIIDIGHFQNIFADNVFLLLFFFL